MIVYIHIVKRFFWIHTTLSNKTHTQEKGGFRKNNNFSVELFLVQHTHTHNQEKIQITKITKIW